MDKLTPKQLAEITQRSRLRLDNGDTPALLDHIKALEEENARYKEALGEILEQIEGDYTQEEIDQIPLLGAICEIINIHLKGADEE